MKNNNNKILGIGAAAVALVLALIVPTTTYAQTTTSPPPPPPVSPSAPSSAAPPTNTTTIITQFNPVGVGGAAVGGGPFPLSQQAIQFQQTDPIFHKLVLLINECMTVSNIFPGGGQVNLEFVQTCKTTIPQGVQEFCSFATLDIAKCNEAQSMQSTYELWAASLFL